MSATRTLLGDSRYYLRILPRPGGKESKVLQQLGRMPWTDFGELSETAAHHIGYIEIYSTTSRRSTRILTSLWLELEPFSPDYLWKTSQRERDWIWCTAYYIIAFGSVYVVKSLSLLTSY